MMESEKANMIEMQEMFIGLEEGRAEQFSDTESDHDVAPVSDGNRYDMTSYIYILYIITSEVIYLSLLCI